MIENEVKAVPVTGFCSFTQNQCFKTTKKRKKKKKTNKEKKNGKNFKDPDSLLKLLSLSLSLYTYHERLLLLLFEEKKKIWI